MKKRLSLKLAILAMLALMLTAGSASADVGLTGDLGIGGHVVIGGHVGISGNNNVGFGLSDGFTFGITPYISISPIDNLSIWTRLPFWEGNFGNDVHIFPFVFGARYYFKVAEKLRVYPGLGIGGSAAHISWGGFGGNQSTGGFALEFHGGVEYEVDDNLAIDACFDIFFPTLGSSKVSLVRIGVMVGVVYYLPVF